MTDVQPQAQAYALIMSDQRVKYEEREALYRSKLHHMEGVSGDRTIFYAGVEMFADLDPSVLPELMDDHREFKVAIDPTNGTERPGVGRLVGEPRYDIHEFDPTGAYHLMVFYPPKGTAFYDQFLYYKQGKSIEIGLSLFQRIESPNAAITTPRGLSRLMESCTLLREPTGWMRLYNASAELLKSIDLLPGAHVYARAMPPLFGGNFFESRLEFFHPRRPVEEWGRAELSEIVRLTAKNVRPVLRPLDEADLRYMAGLRGMCTPGSPLYEILPPPTEDARRLIQAKPIPPRLPQIEAPRSTDGVIALDDHRPPPATE